MARAPRLRRDIPWGWAVGGAFTGFLLALLAFAPARWLTDAVANFTNGQVLLADARGTVWDGSARLVLTGGAGSVDAAALPGRIGWQLHPTWGGVAAGGHNPMRPAGLKGSPASRSTTAGRALKNCPNSRPA